ncbi:hypothetical protein AVEN_45647-1 [Araneus ventricosus]|uniref:Uncharacterized protein n=1 Tax=Araneus ventricosus TaxID=182803 RepID=A0A4Y2EU74_ARAVE|nr:hypothetical protein AVEN_45647-1 [Araneus ventricosus]
MVSNNSIDTDVKDVTAVLIAAADRSIPKSSNTFKKQRKVWWHSDCHEAKKKQRKVWWHSDCHEAKKKQRKVWTRFCYSPSTANLICYKQAKVNSRTIHRRSKRESWGKYISSINSTISSKKLWERVKKNCGISRSSNIRILYNNGIPVKSLQNCKLHCFRISPHHKKQ